MGGEQAEYAFAAIADLRVGRDGTIYVADAQTPSLRAYDASGRFQRWLGRPGAGPSEFRSINALGWRGDTLYAVDSSLDRVTFFAPRGGGASTLRVVVPPMSDVFAPAVPIAWFPDGSGLVRPGFAGHLAVEGRIPAIPLLRVSRDGRVQRTVGTLEHRDHRIASIQYSGGATFLMRPLSGESLLAIAPDGNAFFVVDRPVPRSPSDAQFRVTKIRPRGDTTYSRMYRSPAVAVSAASADSVVDEEFRRHAAALRDTGIPIRSAIREALALPRFQPTITSVVAGRDGTLWLRREGLGRDMVEWTVLDPSGNLFGRVELPARVHVYEAETGCLWGVELDELDVPWIVRYRVQGSGPGRAVRH